MPPAKVTKKGSKKSKTDPSLPSYEEVVANAAKRENELLQQIYELNSKLLLFQTTIHRQNEVQSSTTVANNDKVSQLTHTVASLRSELDDMTQNYEELEEENDILRKECHLKAEEISRLKKELAQVAAASVRDRENMQVTITSLQTRLQSTHEDILRTAVAEEKSRLQQAFTLEHRQNAETAKTLRILWSEQTRRLAQLTHLVEDQQSKISEWETQVAQLEQENANLAMKLQSEKAVSSSLAQELEALRIVDPLHAMSLGRSPNSRRSHRSKVSPQPGHSELDNDRKTLTYRNYSMIGGATDVKGGSGPTHSVMSSPLRVLSAPAAKSDHMFATSVPSSSQSSSRTTISSASLIRTVRPGPSTTDRPFSSGGRAGVSNTLVSIHASNVNNSRPTLSASTRTRPSLVMTDNFSVLVDN